VQHGGKISSRWPIKDVLNRGDDALTSPVLWPLYLKMKDAPHPVDLDALWRQLGIRLEGRLLITDDTAPKAWLRDTFAPDQH